MKRSEINSALEKTKQLLHDNCITLPPYAYWSPEDWAQKGSECNEIRDCMLGWDITDFGFGDFAKVGLTVVTLRNGHRTIEDYVEKTYCEKLLIVEEDQHTPMHFHWHKVEDIINRAGGDMVIQLYNATEDEELDKTTDVTVAMDGVQRVFAAGELVVLKPGESITLPQRLYHEFWTAKGTGTGILGEVSKVNDDNVDNRFLTAPGRFPDIEEDAAPVHLLCTEYPSA